MLKLFLSDVDGTLLHNGEMSLPEKTKERLLRLTRSGVVFAAVSGRDTVSLKKLFDFLPDAYLMGCNGAVCVKGDKTMYSRPIAPKSVIFAWQYASKTRQNVVFCGENAVYSMGDTKFISYVKGLYGDKAFTVRTNADIPSCIYKISFYNENDGGGLPEVPFELRICYERNGWREYVNRYAGKGDAAFDLQLRLALGRSSCAAAGNDMGDAELLDRAGYRFSFDSALARASNAVRLSSVDALFDELERIP